MAKSEIVVRVSGLTKTFRIPTESSSGLKQRMINALKGKKGYRNFTPLKNISFEVNKGDFFGIVGRNGSGKSTLLKSIAGIYEPTQGSSFVKGTLVPFIELGVGFNPELTGRENVFLNGALLGFSRNEMEGMYDEIVNFAEISEFMDEKLKNYSSGMQVRLAFSIAIRAQGDVLLLDEVLAVGDEAFQRKCYQYFAQLKKEKRTVIIVTHDMDSVQRFCNKAIMLEGGSIIERGSVKAVSEKYTELNSDGVTVNIKSNGVLDNDQIKVSLSLKDGNNKKKSNFRNRDGDELLKLIGDITLKNDIEKDLFCSILIKNSLGEVVTRISSEDLNTKPLTRLKNSDVIKIRSEIQNIYSEGIYRVALSIKSIDRTQTYLNAHDLLEFAISGLGTNGYSLRPQNKTTIETVK